MSEGEEEHRDPDAEHGDTRIRVEKSGFGAKIVREEYRMVAYDAPVTEFGWVPDDEFSLRDAGEVAAVKEQLDGVEGMEQPSLD